MAKDERFTQPHAGDSLMMGMENLEECVCACIYCVYGVKVEETV